MCGLEICSASDEGEKGPENKADLVKEEKGQGPGKGWSVCSTRHNVQLGKA